MKPAHHLLLFASLPLYPLLLFVNASYLLFGRARRSQDRMPLRIARSYLWALLAAIATLLALRDWREPESVFFLTLPLSFALAYLAGLGAGALFLVRAISAHASHAARAEQ